MSYGDAAPAAPIPNTTDHSALDSTDNGYSSSRGSPRWCYSRFWLDCTGTCRCIPTFRAVDKIYKTDGSFEVKIIDVAASFSPASTSGNLLIKILVIVWKLIVIAAEWTAMTVEYFNKPYAFFWAFLTTYGLLFAMVYSLFSLANELFPVVNREELKKTDLDEGLVSRRVRFTWAFFNLGAWLEMVVSVLFWGLVYDGGETNTYDVMAHGVVTALVWIDGLLVNRIPIRMRHWFEMGFPVLFLYTIWTVLQGRVFDIDNPNRDYNEIYAVLDWDESPWFALGLVSGLILVFSPLVQLVLLGASLLGRRYVDEPTSTSKGADASTKSASRRGYHDAADASTKSTSRRGYQRHYTADIEAPMPNYE